MKRVIALGLTIVLGGCARHPHDVPTAPVAARWQSMITSGDAERLRNWRTAFVAGLNDARIHGALGDLATEGALFLPDLALPHPALPAGRYHCRVIKLGAKSPGMPSYSSYAPFDCVVSEQGDVDGFAKLNGSQRPVGLLFNDGATRQVFLGTLALGDEARSLQYGQDATRDMVGAVQRVGEARWRLILPYPRFESIIDVIELVPAS